MSYPPICKDCLQPQSPCTPSYDGSNYHCSFHTKRPDDIAQAEDSIRLLLQALRDVKEVAQKHSYHSILLITSKALSQVEDPLPRDPDPNPPTQT